MRFGLRLLAALVCPFSLASAVAKAVASERSDVFVSAYGAIPDDGEDDAAAVRKALRACREVVNPRLVFSEGVYDFKVPEPSGRAYVDVVGFEDLVVQGNQSELRGSGTAGLFHVEGCGAIQMAGFSIDWAELPFTGGRVVAVHDDSIDIEVEPGHPLRAAPIQAFQTFDRTLRAPLAESDADYLLVTQKLFPKPAEILGPDRLRIFISPKPEILRARERNRKTPQVGNDVIAWYVLRGGRAIRLVNCGDAKFADVNIFASPGMGLTANSCGSVSLVRCAIIPRPGTGRWLSTAVDGTHFNMISKRVELIDCNFESMGDDAVNVHGVYTTVHSVLNSRAIIVRGSKTIFANPGLNESDHFAAAPIHSPKKGDMLEFSEDDSPLVPAFEARVVDVERSYIGETMVKKVTLDRDLPSFVKSGTVVGNANEAPEFLMKNCVVRNNRGMGVRLKTRNAIVEDCTFENMSGAGVWITCDASVDFESIATRDVVIRKNTIRGAHTAIAVSAGRRVTYPDVHRDLIIEDNTIESPWPVAINLKSAKGVVIRRNRVSSTGDEPIQVELSSDVKIEGNTITRSR